METKVCSKCGEEKPLNEFEKGRKQCKKCRKEYMKQWREEHKEYMKQWEEEHKEERKEQHKQWEEEHKEERKEQHKQWRKDNKEYIKEYGKQWKKDNPEKVFNQHHKRREKLENQGRGITKEQLNECRNWFGCKCAYSGEILKKTNDTYGRTVDHIVALENGGLNEPWNIIPMRKGYNSSKKDKVNSLDWYMEQEYFNIDRLNKIVEWQIYAYEKWGGEEFGELVLITDLFESKENKDDNEEIA